MSINNAKRGHEHRWSTALLFLSIFFVFGAVASAGQLTVPAFQYIGAQSSDIWEFQTIDNKDNVTVHEAPITFTTYEYVHSKIDFYLSPPAGTEYSFIDRYYDGVYDATIDETWDWIDYTGNYTYVVYFTGVTNAGFFDVHLANYIPTHTIGDVQGLDWSANEGIHDRDGNPASVTIQVSRNGGSSWSNIAVVPYNYNGYHYNWSVTGPASANCKIKLVLEDYAGNVREDISNTFAIIEEASIDPPTLASPANGAEIGGPTAVLLDWNASAGADRYNVQVSTNSSFSNIVVSANNVTATEWTTPTLAEDVYYWHVQASDGSETSGWSSARSFTITTAILPPNLVSPANGAEFTGPTDVLLDWNAASGATSYEIQLALDPGFSNIYSEQSDFPATEWTTPILDADTYYWHVRGTDGEFTSDWSSGRNFVITAPLDIDGDGILDDGDLSGIIGDNPCTGGNTVNCDDNCVSDYNPDQEDYDGDGIGFACDNSYAPILSTFPAQNANNIATTTFIQVNFSTDMNPATISNSSFLVNSVTLGNIEGTVYFNESTDAAAFMPSVSFPEGDIVTAILTDDIESSSGLQMTGGFTWTFTITSCGHGIFRKTAYDCGGIPTFVTAADYNDDGFVDMATSSSLNDEISILLNDGTGDYPNHTEFSIGAGTAPKHIESADINSDGFIDLITSNSGNGSFTIYQNNGSGEFPSNDWTTVTYPQIYDCTPADMNGDGIIDILATKHDGDAYFDTVAVFYNQGNNVFSPPVEYEVMAQPYFCYAADLDNDGLNEIIVTNRISYTVSIFHNEGNGQFGPRQDYYLSSLCEDVTIADLNGNGYLDIAVANYFADVIIMLNDQNGGFTIQDPIVTDGYPDRIVSADYDGDGYVDLAVSIQVNYDNVAILYNNGDATFDSPQYSYYGGAFFGIATIDIDGDKGMDIIGVTSSSANVYTRNNIGIADQPEMIHPVPERRFLAPAQITFDCAEVPTALYYSFQVATDPEFTNVVSYSSNWLTETSWVSPYQFPEGTYYWRVRAINSCGYGESENVRSFSVYESCSLDWISMSSGVTETLYDVWGSSNTNVFVAGYSGTILNFNGTDWTQTVSGAPYGLNAIWGTSGSNVYAVGLNSILHYDGNSWTNQFSGDFIAFNDIWGSSASDIYLAGYDLTLAGVIYHFDGSTWSPLDISGIDLTETTLTAIWGSGSDNIYVAGYSYMDGTNIVFNFDGADWTEISDPDISSFIVQDIWGSSANDIYLGGSSTTSNILHFNGTDWAPVNTGISGTITGIWGSSSSNIYAVGSITYDHHILHYDGSTWDYSPMVSYAALTAIYGINANNIFAVGQSGEIQNHYRPKAPMLYSPLDGKDLTAPATPHLNCNDVYGATGYYFELDGDPNFGSPITSDPAGIPESEWVVTQSLGVGTYYWRAKAKDDCGYGDWSEVWHIDVIEGGLPSCPVLYAYDGTEFYQENPLLTACELSNYQNKVTDFYQLTNTIAPRNGQIVFQLREMENEITYLDEFELITVDHSDATMIGCTVDGQIFAYETSNAPLSVVDQKGNDWTEIVSADDGNLFSSNGSGSLTITFPNTGDNSSLSFSSARKLPCITEIRSEEEPNPKSTAGDISNALTVEQMDESGNWVKLPDIPFRTNPNASFVMGDNLLASEAETITIRISWTGEFATDEIRQYIPSNEIPSIRTWKTSEFELNASNAAAKAWTGFGSSESLVLTKDESIELAFEVDEEIQSGTIREYIVRASGRYEPDYRVYADLIPGSYQLYDNYPNPFNPTTTISYDLPKSSDVRLDIFNILGRRVGTLVEETQAAGHYDVTWNGKNETGQAVSSGIYFYKLSTEEYTVSKKMTLLK